MTKIFALTDGMIPSRKFLLLINRDMKAPSVKFSKDLMELIQSHDATNTNILVVDKYVAESNLVNLSVALGGVFDHIIFIQNVAVQSYADNLNFNVSFENSLSNLTDLQQVQKKVKCQCRTSVNAQLDFSGHFFIRCGKSKIVKIETADILFLEANQNQVRLHLTNNVEVIGSTLTKMEQLLPEFMFIRVHRSFIVNIERIQAIEGSGIRIADRVSIPIGQSYRKLVFNMFQSRILI